MIDNNLKYVREELEMTQDELGLVFGVKGVTVAGWENNHDTIPLSKLVKYSNTYGYSLDYLTGLSRKNDYKGKFDKIDKIKLGKKLKQIRNEFKLSQQEIADECKISQSTYSGYETGQYLVTSFVLYIICKNHNLSMDNIIKQVK
ncbi:MAG: helix-turn-helix transcriptional regulator [Bacilli bacterium]|nr:helix-turn-helix transcriptional regulator [Bacilli bacterium]